MTWAKLDDGFPEHPKVIGLSDAAFRTHVAAICYAARNLTDGHIPAAALLAVSRGKPKAVAELHAAGVWHENGGEGYIIHDYLEYNPSKERVERERERKREGGREGARKRWRHQ